MPKELFPFRYRDDLTGKWVRARYLAERHEIAATYRERGRSRDAMNGVDGHGETD